MTSTIKKPHIIKIKTVDITNVTIGEQGFVQVNSYKPSGMNNFLFALIKTYGYSTKHQDFDVDAEGKFIRGTAGDFIDTLTIAYYYTD